LQLKAILKNYWR